MTKITLSTLTTIFKPNPVLSIALYKIPCPFSFDGRLDEPFKVISSRSPRLAVKHAHTRADPFLFEWQRDLYLFFELQLVGQPGCIAAYKICDLFDFEYIGTVLQQPYHLSYPMVFQSQGVPYMIPESSAGGEMALYEFDEFPFGLRKVRTLLRGIYLDSSCIHYDGLWYIFTTTPAGLELFYTDDIREGLLTPHPVNPITNDPSINRSGGAPLIVDGKLIRLAQDCSKRYGANLNGLHVSELSPTVYREHLLFRNYFDCDAWWNAEGVHHLSVASFRGEVVAAVDGRHRDHRINKILSPAFQLAGKLWRNRTHNEPVTLPTQLANETADRG